MRSRSLSTKLIFVFLFLAVAAYFSVQAYRYFVDPQTTTLVYAYSSEDAIAATGYFARDEQVIACSETLLELERAEGERVNAGGTLATVYRSESALNDHRQLRALRSRLEQLRYAREASRDAETALKLDGDIREDLFALRASLAAGSWTSVESSGEELRTTVLKREYAYAGTDDLDVRIDALNAEISTLSGRLEGGTQTIRAPFAGTYSAVADGYEAVLTPAALENMTVAQYDAIAPEAASSTVGRLIAGEEWRFVTVLSAVDAARLQKGQALSLRAATGVDFDLDVTVERIGREENGRVIVVLRGGSHLAYVTLLRAQNVELILARYEGLRIPKNALRVDADGSSGVYCLVGLRAYRKPVEVLWQGEDYCLVRPVTIDSTSESAIELYTLRVNDEVIISNAVLYLKISAPVIPPMAVLVIVRNMLQGIQHTIEPLLASGLELIGKVIFGVWIVPAVGYTAVCFCEPVTWVICFVFILGALYRCRGELKDKE